VNPNDLSNFLFSSINTTSGNPTAATHLANKLKHYEETLSAMEREVKRLKEERDYVLEREALYKVESE
jgi:cell division protein FtsB